MRATVQVLNLLITIVGVLLFSASLMTAGATSTAVASDTPRGMFNPTAALDTSRIDDLRTTTDTAADDARAEGVDVLPVSYHDAPADLWNALRRTMPGSYDDDVPGIGTFYVPVGTMVEAGTATYFATIDGWSQVLDVHLNGEIKVEMLDIPARTATEVYGTGAGAQCGTDAQCAALTADRTLAGLGIMLEGAVQNVAHVTSTRPVELSPRCVKAARDILRASLSRHVRVEEDLSFRKMPRRVGQCNDLLATAYYADGKDFTGRHGKPLRDFLRHVIRTGELPSWSVREAPPRTA